MQPPPCPRRIRPVTPPYPESAGLLKFPICLRESHPQAPVDPVYFSGVTVVLDIVQDHIVEEGMTPKTDYSPCKV